MIDWDEVYAGDVEDLPWYSEALDEDVERALASRGIRKGTFLDIGTGPGTQAAALAALGFTVVGTDISRRAVSKARRRFPAVKFLVDDIPRTRLRWRFDYIIDRGCFHSLGPRLRGSYVRKVYSLLRPDGLLFLKTSSKREMCCIGPYRFSPAMIRRCFSRDFFIESIIETEFSGTLENKPKALFAVLRRKPPK